MHWRKEPFFFRRQPDKSSLGNPHTLKKRDGSSHNSNEGPKSKWREVGSSHPTRGIYSAETLLQTSLRWSKLLDGWMARDFTKGSQRERARAVDGSNQTSFFLLRRARFLECLQSRARMLARRIKMDS